jgi:hypothetical protein
MARGRLKIGSGLTLNFTSIGVTRLRLSPAACEVHRPYEGLSISTSKTRQTLNDRHFFAMYHYCQLE